MYTYIYFSNTNYNENLLIVDNLIRKLIDLLKVVKIYDYKEQIPKNTPVIKIFLPVIYFCDMGLLFCHI